VGAIKTNRKNRQMENAQKITETEIEKNIRRRKHIEDFIKPENCKEETDEKLSPSGKYKLLIRSYSTSPGCWNHTRGTVTRVSDGTEVCDIVRNYSFTHSFVTKGDVEYLITGRSYMSQTIVNLETGQDMEPQDFHYQGFAFCWVRATLMGDEKTLLVDGCHWAAPYEFRFHDFSDPESKGWPEIPVVEAREWEEYKDDMYDEDGDLNMTAGCCLYADAQNPVLNEDGTITVVQSVEVYKPTGQRRDEITDEQEDAIGEEAYDDDDNWDFDVDVKMTLERRGPVLVIMDVWKSEKQQEKEAQRKAYRDKEAADFTHWKETDEFLKMARATLADHPKLKPLEERIQMCGSSGNARKNGEKNMWFFNPDIYSKKPQEQWTYEDGDVLHDPRCAKLKWGTIDGDTIKAEFVHVTQENGTQRTTEEYPKTAEGLGTALEALEAHLDG